MKYFLSLLIWVSGSTLIAQQSPEDFSKVFEARVVAPSGLNLRDSPGTSGKVISKIPYGEMVRVRESEPSELIPFEAEGIHGFFVPCNYGDIFGYVFSGFLGPNVDFPGESEDDGSEIRHPDFAIQQQEDINEADYNYDPHLHWYALITDSTEMESALVETQVYFSGPGLYFLQSTHQNARYLIGSRKPLKNGLIQIFGDEGVDLLPGSQYFLGYDGITGDEGFDMIVGLGDVSAEGKIGYNELSGEPLYFHEFKDYRVKLTGIHDGEEQVQWLISPEDSLGYPIQLLAAGDFDGDGKQDLIVSKISSESPWGVYLLLSSAAKKGEMVRPVAKFEFYGGC